MGRIRRLGRPERARVGYAVGVLLIAAGVFLLHGAGWALIVAGLGFALYAVVLYDVDEPEPAALESTLRPRRIQDWSDAS